MTSKDFLLLYWQQYIALEKEFISSEKYVSIDEINFSTYSSFYSKILLQIGSEIDIVFKKYCKTLDNSFRGRTIDTYRNAIIAKQFNFVNETSFIINKELELYPWKDFANNKSPIWWDVYNAVKHSRTDKKTINKVKMEAYKFANLNTVLIALCGLYQLLLYLYYHIATSEGKKVKTPIPCSRLFQMNGPLGKRLKFFNDEAFYFDDNKDLKIETGYFVY